MRIVFVSHLHPPVGAPLENMGGLQRVSMQLCSELSRRPEIEVLEQVNHTSWRWAEVSGAAFLTQLTFNLPRRARAFGADVILFTSMASASIAPGLRPRCRVPLVTINHGHDVKLNLAFYQWWVPKVFRALDGVISVSRATREACIERGMDPAKGVALPNGFDLTQLDRQPDPRAARAALGRRLGLELDGRHVVLTVGRMVERKGHAWFLREVFPKLPESCVYLTIGDGPERGEIDRATAKLGPAAARVVHLGKVSDEILAEAYTGADLFVMPNIRVAGDMEGFGIVQLEANIARTPVITAAMEGMLDVVSDGQNGVLCTPEDPRAFISAISGWVQGPPERLAAFGERARAHVLQNFGWDRVADRYVDYLREVIERGRA